MATATFNQIKSRYDQANRVGRQNNPLYQIVQVSHQVRQETRHYRIVVVENALPHENPMYRYPQTEQNREVAKSVRLYNSAQEAEEDVATAIYELGYSLAPNARR